MTTNAMVATVSGSFGGKVFSDTSTDDVWEGNNMLDSVASADLGQVMQGNRIDHVCVTYTAGAALWRIQSRNTLAIRRWGYCSKVGTVDYGECKIPGYTVASDDVLNVYSVAVDATSNQVNALAWIQTSKGTLAFGAQDIADGAATEITSLITTQSLGEYYGSTMQGLTVQVEDGGYLAQVDVIGADGGTIATWKGTVRDAAHYYYNLYVKCNIPITKGTVIKLTTVSA